jgi:hypothetical protein
VSDPKEETDVGDQHSWVQTPIRRLIHDFQESLKKHPPIPPGAADEFEPSRSAHAPVTTKSIPS